VIIATALDRPLMGDIFFHVALNRYAAMQNKTSHIKEEADSW